MPLRRSFARSIGLVVLVVLAIATLVIACGSGSSSTFGNKTDATTGDDEGGPGNGFGGGDSGPCQGLQCQQVACPGGGSTTVSGVVNAPNGTLPLYNVIVFVPNAPLDPIPEGASCDKCGSVSGDPLVSAITDVNGKFTLKDVPVGKNIPLVVQVGKWRREITLPSVAQCVDNPITNTDLTRLPKNQSEGHLPRIAITTGWCDQLACLLPKLGIDASEYTTNTGTGRLNIYRGASDTPVKAGGVQPAPAPTGTPDATTLWADTPSLSKYDMVMLSCECDEHLETKSDASRAAMYQYASAGGRVFASHFHYVWGNTGPLAGTAQWVGTESSPENPPGPFLVDTSFPKGTALAQWLVNVGATTTLGQIPISQPREDVGKVIAPTQRWVYRKDPLNIFQPEDAMYLSVNTPVGKTVAEQCGKFVFADMHLYGGDYQTPGPGTALPDDGYPGSCSKDLTPEEKALAFLFFDLSSCVQDDSQPPTAPVK